MPKISIITPNFNHSHYLRRCVKAAQDQTFEDFEILFVDDASTDNSWEVMQELAKEDDRIRLLRNEKNLRVERSINKALESARGEYVIFRSADDLHLPGFFEEAHSILESKTAAGLCFGELEFCDENGKVVETTQYDLSKRVRYFTPFELARAIGGTPFPTPAMLTRIRLVRELGGFDPLMKWHADWYAVSVIGYRHGICFVPRPLARMTRSESSYLAAGSQNSNHEDEIVKLILNRVRTDHADVLGALALSGAMKNFHTTVSSLIRRGEIVLTATDHLLLSSIQYQHYLSLAHSISQSAFWPTFSRWRTS